MSKHGAKVFKFHKELHSANKALKVNKQLAAELVCRVAQSECEPKLQLNPSHCVPGVFGPSGPNTGPVNAEERNASLSAPNEFECRMERERLQWNLSKLNSNPQQKGVLAVPSETPYQL